MCEFQIYVVINYVYHNKKKKKKKRIPTYPTYLSSCLFPAHLSLSEKGSTLKWKNLLPLAFRLE